MCSQDLGPFAFLSVGDLGKWFELNRKVGFGQGPPARGDKLAVPQGGKMIDLSVWLDRRENVLLFW